MLVALKLLNSMERQTARTERCRKMMRTRSSRESQFRTSAERALLTRFSSAASASSRESNGRTYDWTGLPYSKSLLGKGEV